jgi:hypothetical protein
MKSQRLVAILAGLNLLLMASLWMQSRLVAAQDVAPVLRARALEIVDAQGRRRATLNIQPASTHQGQAYPETVLFRLIDPNGKPIVKLGGAVGNAGLGLNDGSDTTYALIEAKDADAYVRLTTSDGRRQLIKP